MLTSKCSLCWHPSTVVFHQDKKRQYWQCLRCQLVFVSVREHVGYVIEKAEYDLHENHLNDAGYLCFLERLAAPLMARLPPAAKGLDVGCGPAPVLQRLFQARQFNVSVFDKFYANDPSMLNVYYDFVCATEVVEHFRNPGLSLFALWQLVLPKGYLAIMTKRVTSKRAFSSWHYKNDPTHISFFSESSFEWLAAKLQARLEIISSDVVFLHKPG